MAPTDADVEAYEPMGVSKYKNVRTNGYASKREATRAAQLRLLERSGHIRKLREQVAYELLPKTELDRATSYRADFVYEEIRPLTTGGVEWVEVVEDVKGMRTAVYLLKRKMMKVLRGITVREV
jgi:hypothetical protein